VIVNKGGPRPHRIYCLEVSKHGSLHTLFLSSEMPMIPFINIMIVIPVN